MPSKGQSGIFLIYAAVKNGVRVTGDVANHTLGLVLDGVVPAVEPTNAPVEITIDVVGTVNIPTGWYQVELTVAEATHWNVFLVGMSSTADVEIIGYKQSFEEALAAITAAVLLGSAATVEDETVPKDSLAFVMPLMVRSDTTTNAGSLTAFKEDGVTELGQVQLDFDDDAEPIVGVGLGVGSS
jgi:hypothetical protein